MMESDFYRRATWISYDRQYSYLHIDSGYVQWGYPSQQKIDELAASHPTDSTISSNTQSPPPPNSSGQRAVPPIIATGSDILVKFDVPGNWSGRGQHVEFAWNETIPLKEGQPLGRGASADVHEVVCQGTKLARKQIYCSRRMKIEDVKRELDILKKITHKHVVTLIGSYTQNRVLGLVLFPATVCDLGVFLDEMDEMQSEYGVESPRFLGSGAFATLLQRLWAISSTYGACRLLKTMYGCLANAVKYLHDNDIRHKDLKPRNILLDRNGGLFVTDFGISRDNTDASSSVTAGIERGTYKYCAPEVARFEPRGRAADIYSLGCVFLEMNTVYRGESLIDFEKFRRDNEDHSFQNSPDKIRQWILKLRGTIRIFEGNEGQLFHDDHGVFDILDLIEKMLAEDPKERPLVAKVCKSLHMLNSGVNCYFGPCCVEPPENCEEYYPLLEAYPQLRGYFIFILRNPN
jgi:serine/threonine protein kinase